ncbi:tubulin polyglutamylase complex subunit 2 isoform X1 [Tachypleus tridentatus]|uniref:tubulin polyglutamylase complex subunit 2 isoform X1 n=1 Tax=Tachypleus tridentatus TaxID=6853 RepID=UPI003FD37A90
MNSEIDLLTLGFVKYLEKLPCICNVTVVEKEPVDKVTITSWEQRNACILPNDLKNFYLAIDGMQIRWSMKLKEEAVPVGMIEINSIGRLRRVTPKMASMHSDLPTLTDIENDSESSTLSERNLLGGQATKPKYRNKCKVFLLDSCQGNGKVCLVYPIKEDAVEPISTTVPTVWFLDRALEWHYLASTMTAYLRLSLVHLGLPHWQYALTPWGLPSKTKQLMSIFVPERLTVDILGRFEDHSSSPINGKYRPSDGARYKKV